MDRVKELERKINTKRAELEKLMKKSARLYEKAEKRTIHGITQELEKFKFLMGEIDKKQEDILKEIITLTREMDSHLNLH